MQDGFVVIIIWCQRLMPAWNVRDKYKSAFLFFILNPFCHNNKSTCNNMYNTKWKYYKWVFIQSFSLFHSSNFIESFVQSFKCAVLEEKTSHTSASVPGFLTSVMPSIQSVKSFIFQSFTLLWVLFQLLNHLSIRFPHHLTILQHMN